MKVRKLVSIPFRIYNIRRYRLTHSEPSFKLIYINFINILYNLQEKNLIIILIQLQSEPFAKEKILNETFHIQQC